MKIACYQISVDSFIKIFGEEDYWNDTENIRCIPVSEILPEEKKQLEREMLFDWHHLDSCKFVIAYENY